MANLNHFLWLTTRNGFRPAETLALLRVFGSPERAYFAGEDEYDLLGLPKWKKASLLDKDLTRAEEIQADCERLGIHILTIQDAGYPERLGQIDDPPCVLYWKGKPLDVDNRLTVGVVGTRSCTPYGVSMAQRLGLELARAGVILVSGIAEGVDAAGLKGALQGGGTVISVLGGGIDVIYPKCNAWLYEDVAVAGTLVSEYPPGTRCAGYHFPVRNRILSGLSMGVAVAEAGEPSGALITARLALDQNREVFAFPGPADARASLGANRLIQRGEAKLILGATDILEELAPLFPGRVRRPEPLNAQEAAERLAAVGAVSWREKERREPAAKKQEGKKEVDKEPERAYISLSDDPEAFADDERDLLLALAGNTMTSDDLGEAAQLSTRRVLTALTTLQVRGLVEELPGKRFRSTVVLRP